MPEALTCAHESSFSDSRRREALGKWCSCDAERGEKLASGLVVYTCCFLLVEAPLIELLHGITVSSIHGRFVVVVSSIHGSFVVVVSSIHGSFVVVVSGAGSRVSMRGLMVQHAQRRGCCRSAGLNPHVE